MEGKRKENANKLGDMFEKMNYKKFCKEFSKVIFGLEEARDIAICCLLSGGHFLIDSPPGYAKTMLVNSIAALTDMKFVRLQLAGDQTSDAIRGFEIPVPEVTFKFHERGHPEVPLSAKEKQENKEIATKMLHSLAEEQQGSTDREDEARTINRVGPLGSGTQLLLLDEVTRMNPEAINALFSALEEGFFKVGLKEYALDALFTVFGTRNVFDLTGVRALSLAFLDRHACSIMIGRPTIENEKKIACQPKKVDLKVALSPMWNKEDILKMREFVSTNYFFDDDDPIVDYVTRLVRATDPYLEENIAFMESRKARKRRVVYAGASPRALKIFTGIAVVYTHCILGERTIYPEHIKKLAHLLLRHRLAFKTATEPENLKAAHLLIDEIIDRVPILGSDR